jgi:tetratricopeptide (TPR) repeat protein
MKLIRGLTLEKLLGERPGRAHDQPRFVQIFEQVCQTVGFAHAQGVIHRDLKPANVMVGAFGEVQVMDWGLAKEPTGVEGEADPDAELDRLDGQPSGTETPAPSDTPAPGPPPRTRPGTAGGTPGFMSPEQCLGEPLDERADVFALGAILFEILTGERLYREEAAKGELASVLPGDRAGEEARLAACGAESRLAACGADRELVALTARCLAPSREQRPANAGAVAAAVAEYRAGMEGRLQQAEVERATAEAEAREQRKRRKVQAALAAAVGLILFGGALGAWWQDRQATARQVGVETALKLAADLRKQYKFKESHDQLDHAAGLAAGGPRGLKGEVEQARVDLAFAEELDKIRHKKWARVVDKDKRFVMNTASAPGAYREAFKNRGFDFSADDPGALANRVADSAIKAELVAALDDWATFEKDPKLVLRLLEVTRLADPGEWTNRLRDPAVRDDPRALEKLWADAADVAPAARVALAVLMHKRGLDPAPLLTAAQLRDPTNFDINFFLGAVRTPPPAPADQARFWGEQAMYCQAALAVRPDHAILWNRLGVAFWALKKVDLAIVCFRRATDLDREPQSGFTLYNLGLTLKRKGDELRMQRKVAEAINRYREASDCYRQAMESGCGFAESANNLAWLLATGPAGVRDGKLAVEYASLACKATGNQPGCLDTLACAYATLACEYAVDGKIGEAISAKAEALRIGSRFHDHLAWLLATGPDGVRDGKRALEYAARAREQGGDDSSYLDTLACAYAVEGKFDEAVKYETQALSNPKFEKGYGPEGRERLDLFKAKKPYRDPDFATRQVAPPPRPGPSPAGSPPRSP